MHILQNILRKKAYHNRSANLTSTDKWMQFVLTSVSAGIQIIFEEIYSTSLKAFHVEL